MSDDISRDVDKDASNTVEHHVMDILNPTLHHHDLLQSYVRTDVDIGSDSKQDLEEFEEPTKEAHSSKYPTKANVSDNRKNNFRYDGRKKKDDKTKKERSNTTVESEMRIQKSRRKWRQYEGDSRRQEEVYTDKDRAAAVNMGTTDIKQSLKMKQRQDRSRNLQIPEETEPGALLTLGLREMRFGDFNVAVNCINKVHLLASFVRPSQLFIARTQGEWVMSFIYIYLIERWRVQAAYARANKRNLPHS